MYVLGKSVCNLKKVPLFHEFEKKKKEKEKKKRKSTVNRPIHLYTMGQIFSSFKDKDAEAAFIDFERKKKFSKHQKCLYFYWMLFLLNFVIYF